MSCLHDLQAPKKYWEKPYPQISHRSSLRVRGFSTVLPFYPKVSCHHSLFLRVNHLRLRSSRKHGLGKVKETSRRFHSEVPELWSSDCGGKPEVRRRIVE